MADQPFHLLAMLLERSGEVVTRQELEQQLWPGQAELDRADNLNTAVKKVRVALEDEAERPRFIETLPRRGYCFIGHVENVDGKDSSASRLKMQGVSSEGVAERQAARATNRVASQQSGAQSISGRRKRAAVVSGAIAGALFALWWFTPLTRPRVTRIDEITFSARIDTPVKPVVDGQHIYYIRRAGDHWDLMETMLGEGDGRRIDAPGKSAMVLDVSPDHTKLLIATFEKRDGQNELWLAPSKGGAATRLGIIASTAAFSPGGEQIAYANGNSLFMMDANGLNRRKLDDFSGAPSWLSWSADGERLRFTMNSTSNHNGGFIWEVSSAGTNLHPVPLKPVDPLSVCCGTWTRDGRYYVFSSSQGGQWNLWSIRESGSWRRNQAGAVQLTFGPNSTISGTVAADGKHVFYYSGVWRQELQRFDLTSREFVPLPVAGNALQLAYSRDGRWVAYVDGETRALFRCRTDGTDRLELASSTVAPGFPRWSPDSKRIAFEGRAAGQGGALYIVAAAGGPVEQLLANEQQLGDGDWSSDSHHLVAWHETPNKETDSSALLIVDLVTKHLEQVPGSDHLAMSRWSPDGRYISATLEDQTQLKLFDVATKRWQVVARGEALGISVWSPDARYLYFQDLLGRGEQLRRYDVNSKTTSTVFDFSEFLKSGVSRCALFATAPDGSPIVAFNRSFYDLFSADVTLP